MASNKIFIYSTLTSSTKYTRWEKKSSDLAKRNGSVLIQGGSNVAGKHLVTPRGVVTQVTEEQLAILESNKQFQRHVERGYIKIERHEAPTIEKAVSDMTQRDPSAPLVPEDFDAEQAAAPKTNKPKNAPKGEKAAPPPPKG